MLIDYLLSVVTFTPLLGAAVILFVRGDEAVVARNAQAVALFVSTAVFLLSLVLWFNFDKSSADFQFMERSAWIPSLGLTYSLGVDGISVLFVLLATFLTPICILSSFGAVEKRVKEYMIAFLVLETMMIGMFAALDIVLFYIFFEAVLIPMFLIIGVWGGTRRVYAAFKMFLYTFAGSVLMLLAILAMIFDAGTTEIPNLLTHAFGEDMQFWLWLAFFASFAVKLPMWPVHTWLPDAHVEAPTAGSVILAGVLLKMGAYGFLRFSVPMLPEATSYFTPLVFALSVVAIVYTSLVALVQDDMKKLIAYSSVAHMGYVSIGIFTLTQQGIEGAIYQMLAHGIISGALFLCVGVVYDRMHTREMPRYGGVADRMPHYAFAFMVFMMASVGLPGTAGFVGEFLVLVGVFQVNTVVALLAASAMVLGAAYMLWLYRKVIFSALSSTEVKKLDDLSWREKVIFAPLLLLTIWMGVYPVSFLSFMSPSVEKLIANYHTALAKSLVVPIFAQLLGQ